MQPKRKKGGEASLAAAKAPVPKGDLAAAAPSLRITMGAVAGLAAAWCASGAIGLVAGPLRHAITLTALAVAVLVAWPPTERTWRNGWILAGGAALAALLTASSLVVYNLLAVVLVLALLAWMRPGLERTVLTPVAAAVATLAVYRLALASIPTVWIMADALGEALGRLAGAMVDRPLWVGATFGGLDFLVLMAALYVGWLVVMPPPRLGRALLAAAAIVAGHMVYLMLLSCAADLRAALPPAPPLPETDQYEPTAWSWSKAAASLLPWNLPLLAAAIHLALAGAMVRTVDGISASFRPAMPEKSPGRAGSLVEWAPWGLAVVVPVVLTFSLGRSDLSGKRIVVYNEGYLTWEKPVFDRYGQASAGAYGMLPTFVESLGGTLVRSDALSQADLAKADALVLLHPTKPWTDDLQKRVWQYVRDGGSLLIVAEPRVLEERIASAFDEVLAPTAMRVRFDTAIGETYKWEQAIQLQAHPATAGVADSRNRCGLVRGASIDVRWPARPILVGLWGWSDPGSDAMMTQVYRCEAGERLGDLVLAAEQRVGRGTVVVLADSHGLTNEGTAEAYPFTGRLLGYLAWRPSSPQAAWRQVLGLAGCLLLVGAIGWRPEPARLAVAAALMAFCLGAAGEIGSFQSRVLPDGSRGERMNNVAYIDASHAEAYNLMEWTPDNIAGLKLTLMRSGYLPLLLYDFSAEALDRAGMLISIAPARAFSGDERRVVREFVERGGTFVCTVGAEHARPIQPLLEEFGFRVPLCPLPPGDPAEAMPMGNIRAAYLSAANYRADVILSEAWPVEYPRQGTEWFVAGRDQVPAMACARAGKGRVVVIGDTEFAMNKNLEYITGDPFDGGYDNAHFWRWLILKVNRQPDWTPPNSASGSSEEDADEFAPARAAAAGLPSLHENAE